MIDDEAEKRRARESGRLVAVEGILSNEVHRLREENEWLIRLVDSLSASNADMAALVVGRAE
jgi:hypothetical protein